MIYFYNDNLKGKTVRRQFIDETGAWIQFTDGSLLKIHNDKLVDNKDYN
jgi:hypothetical protein